jgi:hypothetical protein
MTKASSDLRQSILGKREEKRPLFKISLRCKDNIKLDLKLIFCGGVYWKRLAQRRVQRRTS